MTGKPVTAIIVGAGHRSLIYASLAVTHPEMLKIVGVADPNPTRRNFVKETFGFSDDMCFESAHELAAKGKLADAIINDNLFCNSETLKEQVSHIYRWTAVEDDGYTHSEAGLANNMLDAFIKATEYSPSYHKKIVIEKIPDDELTAEEKELKEFWTNA
jgi:hypothetical protein